MLAGALMQTRYGKRAQLPLRSYAGELNPYKADFGAEPAYVALQQPASVTVYQVGQDIRFDVSDRTGTATHVDWEVHVYHDGLAFPNQSYRIDLDVPDVTRTLSDVPVSDSFFLEATDLVPGYNTIVARVVLRKVVIVVTIPPPIPGFPAFVVPVPVIVSNDVVAMSEESYTLHNIFTAEDAELLPSPETVLLSDGAVLPPVPPDAVAEAAVAVPLPEVESVVETVPATIKNPFIKG